MYIPSFVNDVTKIISARSNNCQAWKSSWQQELKKCGYLVNHLLDCMLTLVQDAPRSFVLEKQLISQDVGAENDGVASHQSPGQNNPITLEEHSTSKDVAAENDGVASHQYLEGKTTVKSTLKSLAYLNFFRALPGIHPSRTAVPKEN